MHTLSVAIDLIAIILAFAIGINRWRNLPVFLRIITAQAGLALSTEIASHIVQWYGSSTTALLNYYVLLEIPLLIYGTQFFFRKHNLVKPGIYVGIALYLITWGACVHKNGIHYFVSHAFVLASVEILFFYIIILIALMDNSNIRYKRKPINILCISLIMYFGCNIPLFGLLNLLIEGHRAQVLTFFYINIGLSILRYLGYALCFMLYKDSDSLEAQLEIATNE